MAKAILFIESSPISPEREAEYNDWYDNTHLPEVLAVPGFVSARRYKVENPPEGRLAYAAIYEIESDDPDAALANIGAAIQAGEIHLSDSIQPGASIVYRQL